jgi:uncharacterized protein (UPF0276 family)
MTNRFGLPEMGIGLGLRTVHYAHILENQPPVAWFEILSENYMLTEGRPLAILDQIAEKYPVAMHGVSMSIGSADPLDMAYLKELRALKQRTEAKWVSDHLCFTGIAGKNTHDLLPMPFTEEALKHVVSRVKQVQDFLDAPLALENPSSYLEFRRAPGDLTEWDFLAAIAREADCALLLDVNNVYVSSHNHGYDADAYLDAIPWDRVVQLHLAGHTDHGTHIVDSHIGPVPDPVWALYEKVRPRTNASVLLEWDAEIPEFDVVFADAQKAAR